MEFEWDETKSRANQEKNGVSFSDARNLWAVGNRLLEIPVIKEGEKRWVVIGEVGGKVWTAVITYRVKIRIISFRLASKNERGLYERKAEEG